MQPMQPEQVRNPNNMPTTSDLSMGTGMSTGMGTGMDPNIEKLKSLLTKRGSKITPLIPPMLLTITTTADNNGIGKYTRKQLEDLYSNEKTANRQSIKSGDNDNDNDGYFDKLFFIFQLYIAFINALMDTANMSASIIFGNESLQNAFSNFLINSLNMILNVNVRELNPEQIRDLLEQNRPVLQQISDILIDQASQLLVGLSDVCKKVAMDWMQNVVPGLVKNAAIGIPSAIEAAIPPLGEVVDIINTVLALMGGFMKLVDGVERNYDTVSQGFNQVQGAYDSLQKIKDLLTQQPAEFVKSATSAVITPAADDIANEVVRRGLPGVAAAAGGGRGGLKKMKSRRRYLKNPKQFKTYISQLRNKTAKKEVELMKSIRELKNM
jgi:hypothetical protein